MTHRIEPIKQLDPSSGRTIALYCGHCDKALESMPRSYRHLDQIDPLSPTGRAGAATDPRSTDAAANPIPEQRPATGQTGAAPVTLDDQMVVSQYRVDHVASRDDMVHSTYLSGRVGRNGTDRHAVHAEVWEATPEKEHPLPGYPRIPARPRRVGVGSVHCGSQRGMSGVHSLSVTAPVTCERCLGRFGGRFAVESLPSEVITTGTRGELVPR